MEGAWRGRGGGVEGCVSIVATLLTLDPLSLLPYSPSQPIPLLLLLLGLYIPLPQNLAKVELGVLAPGSVDFDAAA